MAIKMIKPSNNETIRFIKKMARLHNKLSDIMEDINFCYSFQVCVKESDLILFEIH